MHNLKTVERETGELVAVSRSGRGRSRRRSTGRERERYKLPYGANISRSGRRRGRSRSDHRELGSAHPPDHHRGGRQGEVRGHGRGVTDQSEDRRADRSDQHRVIDPKDRPAAGKDLRPAVRLVDGKGELVLPLPGRPTGPARILSIEDGAKSASATSSRGFRRKDRRRRDITGGLPRVADLFEARKPKEPAIIAEATGTVFLRQGNQGQASPGHHAGRTASRWKR